jgi:hypothetical protein
MYKAKKVVCPLRLDVRKMHACPNNCILYHDEEYENLNECPVCDALHIRSGEMNPMMLRESAPGRGFMPR